MNEVRYTIPGSTRVRTAPESAVGTRAWKAQGCQLVPEMKPRPVAPIEPVQEPVQDEPEVTKRGPGRPKANANADQA